MDGSRIAASRVWMEDVPWDRDALVISRANAGREPTARPRSSTEIGRQVLGATDQQDHTRLTRLFAARAEQQPPFRELIAAHETATVEAEEGRAFALDDDPEALLGHHADRLWGRRLEDAGEDEAHRDLVAGVELEPHGGLVLERRELVGRRLGEADTGTLRATAAHEREHESEREEGATESPRDGTGGGVCEHRARTSHASPEDASLI